MRNILFSCLVLILIAMFTLMLYRGISLGNIRIGYSIQDILVKNKQLDADIASLDEQIKTEYDAAEGELERTYSTLQADKKSYQDKLTYASEEEINGVTGLTQYRLEYLWTKIGLHSKDKDLKIKLSVVDGSSGVKDQFDIQVVAIGSYTDISDFVYNIEKDSTLGFRVQNFTIFPDPVQIEKEEKEFNDQKNHDLIEEDAVFVPSCSILEADFSIVNVPIDPASLAMEAQWQDPNAQVEEDKDEDGPTIIDETQEDNENDSSGGGLENLAITESKVQPNNISNRLAEGGM